MSLHNITAYTTYLRESNQQLSNQISWKVFHKGILQRNFTKGIMECPSDSMSVDSLRENFVHSCRNLFVITHNWWLHLVTCHKVNHASQRGQYLWIIHWRVRNFILLDIGTQWCSKLLEIRMHKEIWRCCLYKNHFWVIIDW